MIVVWILADNSNSNASRSVMSCCCRPTGNNGVGGGVMGVVG